MIKMKPTNITNNLTTVVTLQDVIVGKKRLQQAIHIVIVVPPPSSPVPVKKIGQFKKDPNACMMSRKNHYFDDVITVSAEHFHPIIASYIYFIAVFAELLKICMLHNLI